MATATNRSRTPATSATSRTFVSRPWAKTPYENSATAAAATIADTGSVQRAKRDVGITAPSRTAAIGSIRVARNAGRRLASSAISVPTARLTTIVRVVKTIPPLGSSKPVASRSCLRPIAIASPRKSPTIEPMIPTTSDSSTTEPST